MAMLGSALFLGLYAALGASVHVPVRESAADTAMERCKGSGEASERMAACSAVIASTRDKSLLGRAYNRRAHTYVELKNYLAAARLRGRSTPQSDRWRLPRQPSQRASAGRALRRCP